MAIMAFAGFLIVGVVMDLAGPPIRRGRFPSYDQEPDTEHRDG